MFIIFIYKIKIMSTDFELFPGKNLSGLFEDIYNNQISKKQRISEVIQEMRNMVRHAGDLAVVGPLINNLIETSVKNDDLLIKLATIAQRLVISNNKSEGEDGYLSAEERNQLLQEINEVEDMVMANDEIEEVKKKIK